MASKGKILTYLKAIFYIFVIIGIIVYALDLYTTRGEWKATINEPPVISFASTSELEIQANLTVYNPSHSSILAKSVWYNIYIDGVYIGDGFIPYLNLKPGNNTVRITTKISILNLPCATIKALSSNKPVNITVNGYLVASIKLYGKIGYKEVTVPFNTTAYTVNPPSIPEGAKALLKLASTICNDPEGILKIINTVNQTGGFPFP